MDGRCRVLPEGGFKNRKRIPDLTIHNSGSCYQNRNIYFLFPVNPEPEFQFLVPAKPEPEIGFHRISGWNLPEFIFPNNYFIPKGVICILNIHVKF